MCPQGSFIPSRPMFKQMLHSLLVPFVLGKFFISWSVKPVDVQSYKSLNINSTSESGMSKYGRSS